jgi:hypothetical protein
MKIFLIACVAVAVATPSLADTQPASLPACSAHTQDKCQQAQTRNSAHAGKHGKAAPTEPTLTPDHGKDPTTPQ